MVEVADIFHHRGPAWRESRRAIHSPRHPRSGGVIAWARVTRPKEIAAMGIEPPRKLPLFSIVNYLT
jgi:hypothetical protein